MSDLDLYVHHARKVIEALRSIEKTSKEILTQDLELPPRVKLPPGVARRTLLDHQKHMQQIFEMIHEHLAIHSIEFASVEALWSQEDPRKAAAFNASMDPGVKIHLGGNQKSLEQILAEHDFKVLAATSVSDSIIVKVFAYSQKCVLKLTADSPPNNNSLQVERDIYSLVKTKISKLTPHFLPAIDVGQSQDQMIINMRISQKPNENSLYKRWIILRMNAIFADFPNNAQLLAFQRSVPLGAQQNEFTFAEYLLVEPFWQLKHRTVHYALTKEMPGMPLGEFLKQPNLPAGTLDIIMLQIAQALAVLASKHIMHNDLHFGNIFIETFNEVQTLAYTYPRKINLRTFFVVTIFDFDRGATPQIRNKGLDTIYCPIVGQCSDYQPKFDWYTVLSHMIYNAIENRFPQKEIQPFINILGNLYEPRKPKAELGSNAFFALPCTCTKLSADGQRCEACEREQLTSLISPEDYFLQQTSGK